MRILIIGSVAAGTSAAAKARRNSETAEIVIYEKDKDISYSGCGLPYYIGGEIKGIGELTPRDASFFKSKYNIDIFVRHEVLKIDPQNKELTIKNLSTDEIFADKYDKLIIATGAVPMVPNIKGVDKRHVFFLRNVQNAKDIRGFIENEKPQKAAVVGTGFIGFEMLENLMKRRIDVTIIEKQGKLTPNLDEDMADYLEEKLIEKNINIIKNADITQITKNKIIFKDSDEIEADMVIIAAGVKPNVFLARQAGIELGITGAIKVDKKMQTSNTDIYSCGDCIETYSMIDNKPTYRPLGSTANKTGRIAGDVVTGGALQYRGNLGTGIFKLFEMTIANTGLTENQAVSEGYDIEVSHNIKPNRPEYYNGQEMIIKSIADKKTQRLLGVQIIGSEGVDKRIDIFATLINYGAKVDEIFHLDLAYAPPYSTAKDPVHYTGMILDNALNRGRGIITSNEIRELAKQGEKIQVIDVRENNQYKKSHVCSAINIPQEILRGQCEDLDKDTLTVTYCNKGITGNAAQNILINRGFKKVKNLSGGHKFYAKNKNY